jgi:hypothetical protein
MTARELTAKQRRCLEGILELKSAKEIGRDVRLSHHALEQHLKAARKKLEAKTHSTQPGRSRRPKTIRKKPYYDISDVLSHSIDRHDEWGLDNGLDDSDRVLRDPATPSGGAVYGFSSAKTVGLIIWQVSASLPSSALLIAVAEGVRVLMS